MLVLQNLGYAVYGLFTAIVTLIHSLKEVKIAKTEALKEITGSGLQECLQQW